jgi:signal transduction histidine kinase
MLFARPPQLRPARVDLHELLRRIADELTDEAKVAGVSIIVQAKEQQFDVRADSIQLAVALKAICANAIEAMPKGGKIEMSAASQREGDATAELASAQSAGQEPRPPDAEITIADNGPGIPADIRPKIFDPFFSGREAGRGLGFGLSKAWRLITLHGGTIEVRETPGGGATFVIALPSSIEQ